MAQALVQHLTAQKIVTDDGEQQLFGGVFAIFGHGNVICLGEALYESRALLPTWPGRTSNRWGSPRPPTRKLTAGVGYALRPRR